MLPATKRKFLNFRFLTQNIIDLNDELGKQEPIQDTKIISISLMVCDLSLENLYLFPNIN